MENPLVTLSTALSFLLLSYVLVRRWQRRAALPPGPKGLPIIGNVLDMPKERPWAVFRDWSLHYGSDVIFLDLPREPTIVLNSMKSVTDLLDKRSNTYSDRKIAIMDELTGWEWNFAFLPYGQRWRNARRTFHQYLNQNEVWKYQEIQARELRALLSRLSNSPGRVDLVSVSQMFSAIVLDVVYGARVTDKDDRYVMLSQKAVEGINIARVPGTFLVEYLPFLRYIPAWVPGSSARKWGEQYKPITVAMRNEPYEAVKQAMENGIVSPSITRSLMEENLDRNEGTPLWEDHDQLARDVTGVTYAAAVDTQNAASATFFLAMCITPSAQRKAQLELNAVVGTDRLPTFDDLPALPYIQAIFMEVMRWAPVTPLAIPHRVMEDDVYNGYLIPKGATVIGNVWAILHDSEVYSNPEAFDPDRFMSGRSINPDVPSPETASFGFGRRVCPGRHMAKNALQLMFASILHIFDIEPLPGVKVVPSHTSNLISTPKDVPCSLKPRNEKALRLLESIY